MERLLLYKKQTSQTSIVVSICDLDEEKEYQEFEITVSNGYHFSFTQDVFINGGTKKVILNKLRPDTLYRIDARVKADGVWTELESVLHRTLNNRDYVVAVMPTGALTAEDAEI